MNTNPATLTTWRKWNSNKNEHYSESHSPMFQSYATVHQK